MKSHVTIEQQVCPVCGKEHDTGAILFDRRLRAKFEPYTTTSWGLCDEHQSQHNDGYVFLIEVDERKSVRGTSREITLEGAWRTGNIVAIRRPVAERIFAGTPILRNGMMFCDSAVVDKLRAMQETTAP